MPLYSDSPFHDEATSAANYRVQNTFPREQKMMGLNYHVVGWEI